ncbi:MAG: cbb3-type cytochrome c oxidase subunit I [Gemmatimonadota bacterium]|nr:cbb3-type cytochrome c oxidase subunit I [Gemmatimonadota bacterium]
MARGLLHASYDQDGFRTCQATHLRIHRSAEVAIKVFGLTAVVALIIGGIAALLVALTRWEAVGLLQPADFYKYLSLHAWNLLIFWMVFMEVAVLYLGGPVVLGRKLPAPRMVWTGWSIMAASAVLIEYAIWTTKFPDQQPLLTSYPPLKSAPLFYLGAITFILGTVVAALPFFFCIWQEKREHPGRTLPLVTFGAFVTGIIAVESLVGGLIAYVPTFLWRVGIVDHIDAAWYRQMYWIIGHGTQQINLISMITVWYFLTHVLAGAEVVSEKVSRGAFILYLFFINMGAAHHLMADPTVSSSWRMWNTSYAVYGAVFASLIHAFAIPAGLEAGRRKRGLDDGSWFGWFRSAPWHDPAFSATMFSIILFGFLCGITGVIMGQMQLNTLRHNTLAVVGHFHACVALGTTLTFMGLLYYVIRLFFQKEWVLDRLARLQPYLYAGGMGIVVMAMMEAGILYGVPRRDPIVTSIPGTTFNFAAAGPMLAVLGLAACLAVLAGGLFIVIALGSLLFGDDARVRLPVPLSLTGGTAGLHNFSMRGTLATGIFFLIVMGLFYGMDWVWLSRLWAFGT